MIYPECSGEILKIWFFPSFKCIPHIIPLYCLRMIGIFSNLFINLTLYIIVPLFMFSINTTTNTFSELSIGDNGLFTVEDYIIWM